MRIVALNDKCSHTLPSGAVRKVPKDWTGEFPDLDAEREIQAGNAQSLTLLNANELRPDQVAALAVVADNVLIAAAQEARAALMTADLERMTVADLRQLADACGVAVDAKAKKADLVSALDAARLSLVAPSDSPAGNRPEGA